MDIVGSVNQKVKINRLYINNEDEVIRKISLEVLLLFKIEVRKDWTELEEAAYDIVEVENSFDHDAIPITLISRVTLVDLAGKKIVCCKQNTAWRDEMTLPAMRRLMKKNLYQALQELLGGNPAPWGILHGVRPTKIVHKYIRQGLSGQMIKERLAAGYEVQPDKAELLTELAFRQLPFLKQDDLANQVSVYIGVPFCLSRCLYCSFPSYVLPDNQTLQEYMTVFRRDLAAAAEIVRRYDLSVQTVYIGGGTPTSFPNHVFAEFLSLVKTAFVQSQTIEFTVEAGRPDSVNDYKIRQMITHGVNRVSVNPQTMQEKTLKHIGRNHTVSAIIELFDKFRVAGMQYINMDLIIGLPGEGVIDIEDTMRQIAALSPDNLTLHALALKKGSGLKLNREAYKLPDNETAEAMFAVAMRYASSMGLKPYYLYRQGYMSGNLENIGYSKPGAEGLYNIKIMEEKQTIIGVGPAATSKAVDRERNRLEAAFHAKDLATYLKDVDKYIEKRAVLLQQIFDN